MGLAQERWQHRHRQQHQQPWHIHRHRDRDGHERDHALHGGEQQREEAQAADGLAAGTLQPVVDLRVLQLLEVQRGGVAHQPHAGVVGEPVAQKTLEQPSRPAQHRAGQGDSQLRAQQRRQPAPVGIPIGAGHRRHHLVNYQFPDPEQPQRHQRPGHPDQDDAHGVARLGLPDQLEQPGQVAHGTEPLAPCLGAVFLPERPPSAAPAPHRAGRGQARPRWLNIGTRPGV